LWRLLLPIGRRISIETLEGQILAIDASIWLTQFLTVAARQREQELLGDGAYGGTKPTGKAYSYDYLVGFLRRLCKLRYQGVRPVLVFDGETPEIKKREIRERNMRRKRKLGETFYLGDTNNNNSSSSSNSDVPTQEEEEMLEATRRMAKRILAKQLKSGQLVTTKNKKLKTMKTQGGSAPTNLAKSKTIATASYAPGFYDPDASRVVASEQQQQQGNGESKDTDDDHLLLDDYNANPLKEEINDWDKPIVVDSDDDGDKKSSQALLKRKPIAKYLKKNSKFHAGDGTKFKVESVADLPESARKDVIEDARKQRRLASRREFMGVASNPDGLSSCQLRNFLKSTKLNQDIAAMAQQAKKKAEEEAKITLGNGILFEKDNDKGGFTASNRRQHYRSGSNSRKGRKNRNLGMMRMFHHKDQNDNSVSKQTTNNNNDSDNDEHDFRKTRNNHYLSGGIPFVNRAQEKEEDDYMEEHLDEERDALQTHFQTKVTDDDGGFAIAITDGSDKPRKKNNGNTITNKGDGGDIIEIEISSESDDDDSDDDRKPAASKQKSKKSSQEMQDEALARALQTIEEEEMDVEENAIEVNESDSSDNGGGFFRNALPSSSREQNDSQQERDDARLARALQEAEYDEAEDSNDGGDFLVSEKKDSSDENEETMDQDGGFLFGAKVDNIQSEDDTDNGGGFLPAERQNRDDKAENENPFAPNHSETIGIFAMSKERKVQKNVSNLLMCPESSEEEEEDDIDWEDGNENDDIPIQYKEEANAGKTSEAPDISEKKDICAINVKDVDGNNCDEVDDDNGDDDDKVDWKDGAEESIERKSAANDISVAKNGMEPPETTKVQEIKETNENDDDEVNWEEGDNKTESDTKIVEKERINPLQETALNSDVADENEVNEKSDDKENDEVGWEDGNNESSQRKSGEINLCDEKKSDDSFEKVTSKKAEDEDDEVDWEDGDEKTERSKPEIIDLSEAENDNTPNAPTSKYFGSSTNSLSKPEPMEKEENSDDGIEWKAGEEGGKATILEPDDWGVTKSHKSNEVLAALEHAQGTAANLTNWAGRAFRRAVAQHAIENGMEVPESAKPSVLKSPSKDVDREEVISYPSKADVHSPQRISQASIPSRKQERRENTDNSSWLETIDTAYTEDYTVAPQESNSSDRLLDGAEGVTEEMRTEVMQLLRLFGIPYVVAPAEAEAQCVELERLGLVDGIVTEDSDTFVFGGQVVYKNIFDDKKYVEVYHAKDATEEMNLTQDSLVALAMLLGGDYTEGVKGVGIVNGMEVLQAFDVAQDCEEGLKRFRKWLDGFDPFDQSKKGATREVSNRSEQEQVFHRKHHTARTRWIAPKHFPDAKVLNAYRNPVVDTSTERFSWGIPDLDGLIAFCHGHMGWVAEETERLILPIIRQMEDGSMRQTRIDSFMRYEDGIKFAKIQSKRLRHVLGLKSNAEEGTRRKRIQNKAATEDEEKENTGLSEEDSFGNPDEEIFAAMDAIGNAAVPNPPRKKKKYEGKKSLAALSSASASTIAIASSSKGDDILPVDGTSVAPQPPRKQNLPKKAPPSYQKQSSTILEQEQEKESAAVQQAGEKSKTTYEVINPNMVI